MASSTIGPPHSLLQYVVFGAIAGLLAGSLNVTFVSVSPLRVQ